MQNIWHATNENGYRQDKDRPDIHCKVSDLLVLYNEEPDYGIPDYQGPFETSEQFNNVKVTVIV